MHFKCVGKFIATSLCVSLLTTFQTASASDYPSKPVTLVVPFAPGGDADIAARTLAQAATDVFEQPLVVVNRAGASGTIGSIAVMKAAPDGYTLLMGRVGPQAILPALRPNLAYKWNDFTPIGILDLSPVLCTVHADSPYKTLQDLVKSIQAQPGKLNYSSSGSGTILHLAPLMIFQATGLGRDAAIHVPYKGGSEAAVALMSKEVDFSCGNYTTLAPHVKRGSLRALFTTSPEPIKELPHIPTVRQTGMPQLEALNGWNALYAPRNISKEVIEKWSATLQRLSTNPNWMQATERSGAIPKVMSPSDTEKFVSGQIEMYSELGKKFNIVLD